MDFKSKKLEFQRVIHDFYSKFMLYLFSERKTNYQTTKRCVIYTDDNILYLLYADCLPQLLKIHALEKYPFRDEKELRALIGTLSRQYDLQTTPVFWVINEKDYQVFFLESLPVPEAEVRQALAWRLKSTQKTDETLIDYFYLPVKTGTTGQAMITAVSAYKKPVEDFVNICKKYYLNLQVIDIPEMALRNLTTISESHDKSTALIYVQKKQVILNITKGKQLYLTRKIALDLSSNNNNLDEFSLEVIRYFDYFQNYWRHPTPSKIYIIADEASQTVMKNKLSQLLSGEIKPFTIEYSVATSKAFNHADWLLLGELCREIAHDTTTN